MTTPSDNPPPVSPRADSPESGASARPASPSSRSRTALFAALGLLLLLAVVGLTWALMRGQDAGSDPVAQAPAADGVAEGGLAAQDLNGDGIVYQSGMHPWIVQDEPGQCPICGMDLQPVPVSGTTAEGTVEIDPVTLQTIGVRTDLVRTERLSRSVRTTGQFEASERGQTVVSLRVGGWVERLYVNATGDRVRAGQPLLELYSPELVATQQEYLLALRTADMMGDDGARVVESARRRLELFGVTDAQIERLAQGGEATRTITIYSPASGTVTELGVVEGMQAQAGRTLMQIADLSSLWLQVDVPERDLGWVDTQTRAVVEVDSRPGDDLRGRVEYVYDTLDPMTRTGTARIVVPNPGGRLKPGMFATATLNGRPSEPLVVVPSEAVIRTGTDAVVIRALGEGRFEPQPVTLGQQSGGLIQILSGLSEGEHIVTSAQFLIDSEARLAASIGAMSSAPAPAANSATSNQR